MENVFLCKTTDSSVEFKIRSVGIFLNKMGERCEGRPRSGRGGNNNGPACSNHYSKRPKGKVVIH
eukprot:scaffold167415_cov66-Cyclotella_meneghiniana.AAC.3